MAAEEEAVAEAEEEEAVVVVVVVVAEYPCLRSCRLVTRHQCLHHWMAQCYPAIANGPA